MARAPSYAVAQWRFRSAVRNKADPRAIAAKQGRLDWWLDALPIMPKEHIVGFLRESQELGYNNRRWRRHMKESAK